MKVYNYSDLSKADIAKLVQRNVDPANEVRVIVEDVIAHVQQNGDSGTGSSWTFGFALDLPSLGPIQGELQLRDLRLSVRLWAERADTVHRLELQFGALRHALSAAGLILDQLSCQLGLPHSTNQHSAILLRTTA